MDELQRARLQRLRADIAFVFDRGRDGPHLLVDAAKRLESVDPASARETYLGALGAAMYAGRADAESGVRVVAEAARAEMERSHSFAPAALQVGGLTLFASVLYYVFIVNGSIAWGEVGVTDPMAISKHTFIPSLFILAGALLFRFVSRYSNAVMIATFMLLFGLGLGGIGLARTPLEMQLALILQQTGAGMAVPALIAWAQSRFSFEHRGRGMGVWTSAFFLGQAVSPIVVGNLAKASGSMQQAFVLTGAIAIVTALLFFGVSRRGSAEPAVA